MEASRVVPKMRIVQTGTFVIRTKIFVLRGHGSLRLNVGTTKIAIEDFVVWQAAVSPQLKLMAYVVKTPTVMTT